MLLDLTMRRPFGSTGLAVSPVAFGSAPVGLLATEQAAAGRLLDRLLDEGLNVIDTAAAYLGAEEVIGATVGHRRSEYVLVTKCGAHSGPKGWVQATKKAEITEHLDRSLKRLRTEVIDVLLVHSLPIEVMQQGWPLEALEDAKNAGKIRFGGYSGDNEAAAWAVQQPGVAVLQTSVNIVDQANIDAVLPIAAKRGVAVLAKRSIANACWRPPADHYDRYADYVAPYRQRLAAMGLVPDWNAWGAANWAELALRFTLSFPQVHAAIIGGTSLERMLDNLKNASKGPLPKATVDHLRATFAKARAGGGEWGGLT